MNSYKLGKWNVEISGDVLEITKRYRQFKKNQHEAGGILLGQIKDNFVYVLRASIPNVFDKASRYSFDRDRKIAQIIVDYEFTNSKNRTIYLGEWHTHPEPIPIPSQTDKKMIMDQFKYNNLNEAFVLLLIQGTEGIYLGKYDGDKIVSINNHD